MASRSRGNSVLASVRGFLDKDTASKQKVEGLNEPGGFVHFYGKNKDKSKQVYIRIEPTGIRFIERPKDEVDPNPDDLKKALSDAPLHLYTAWAKFQMDSINDIVSIWVTVPKTAAAPASDDSDKKKKKKKKDEPTPASPSGETTQQELYFRVRRTLDMKQKVYSHMEELKKKMGGPSIRDRSASVAVRGPPRPQFKKEEPVKKEEPKPVEESKKPKREKREFNRKKKDDEPESPKKTDEEEKPDDTPKSSKSESSDVIADSEKKTKKDKKKKADEPLPSNEVAEEKKEPEAPAESKKKSDAGEEPKKKKKKAKKSAEGSE